MSGYAQHRLDTYSVPALAWSPQQRRHRATQPNPHSAAATDWLGVARLAGWSAIGVWTVCAAAFLLYATTIAARTTSWGVPRLADPVAAIDARLGRAASETGPLAQVFSTVPVLMPVILGVVVILGVAVAVRHRIGWMPRLLGGVAVATVSLAAWQFWWNLVVSPDAAPAPDLTALAVVVGLPTGAALIEVLILSQRDRRRHRSFAQHRGESR